MVLKETRKENAVVSFRLLPAMIVAAALILTVKVSGLWRELTTPIVSGTPADYMENVEATRWGPPLETAAGPQSGAFDDEHRSSAPAIEPGAVAF